MTQLEFDFMKPQLFGDDWGFGTESFCIESWVRIAPGAARYTTAFLGPVERNYDNSA